MSTEGDTNGKEKNKLRAKASGDLNRVTDYVEEREVDTTKVADSMRAMLGNASTIKKATADKELLNVKIQQSDIQLIVDELDLDPKDAEKALRKARGDVVKALCELVR